MFFSTCSDPDRGLLARGSALRACATVDPASDIVHIVDIVP